MTRLTDDNKLKIYKQRRTTALLKIDKLQAEVKVWDDAIKKYEEAPPVEKQLEENISRLAGIILTYYVRVEGKSNAASPICVTAAQVKAHIDKVYYNKGKRSVTPTLKAYAQACTYGFGDSITMKEGSKVRRGYRVAPRQ